MANKRQSGYYTSQADFHKKIDEPGIATSTTRYCKARISNRWGVDISNVTLRHRRGNNEDREEKKTWPTVKKDEDTDTMDITFETGLGAPGDYWWVEFSAANDTWTCKDNFYCDLRSDDDGKTVDCILKAGDEEMHVSMNSGSCDVTLYKK